MGFIFWRWLIFVIREKNTHERDLNIEGWTVYLFAWCFSVISFPFDSLVYSVSVRILGEARERERITLLQCMFVQCLCIPTIWHHYVRSSVSFILFITFCCVARHRTTLFYASLLSSAFDIIIIFLFSFFTVSFYVYSLLQMATEFLSLWICVGSCAPFTLYVIRIGNRLPWLDNGLLY